MGIHAVVGVTSHVVRFRPSHAEATTPFNISRHVTLALPSLCLKNFLETGQESSPYCVTMPDGCWLWTQSDRSIFGTRMENCEADHCGQYVSEAYSGHKVINFGPGFYEKPMNHIVHEPDVNRRLVEETECNNH